ncbi:MAG: glucose-1-phosphate adenylyltransferase [Peptococcaceae bacterium]|nr:glucose-1-phosphate adenylyltransferase [Peptococcaceae bacterium]
MATTDKKECVAMLLAGGAGSRLWPLTEYIAKPAITFGGKYRIIDFTMSNCVHSGIDTVGVLTQYMPLFLNDYIGKGHPWDLDLMSGGVFLLPPFSSGTASEWYSGTANAIYQNRRFIEGYNPTYLLVLSGDHVYKMDYSLMLASHKKNGADCTIGVIEVPIEEASRYGVINTGAKDKIVEFEEKPEKPKNNLASMGIYVFNWLVIRDYLERDDKDEHSSKDFGKNVLPSMLADGMKMFAYRFKGYWKDVGTLESLWEANMDMIKDTSLGMSDWLILSRSRSRPPHHIDARGRVRNSIVASDCQITGAVENSVLSRGVVVEESAVVRNSVVMADAVIKRGAVVEYAILDERSSVEENAVVGQPREKGGNITVVPGSWN